MRECKSCQFYESKTNKCKRWNTKIQKPETACTNHRYKDVVLGVKTVKESKYVTY